MVLILCRDLFGISTGLNSVTRWIDPLFDVGFHDLDYNPYDCKRKDNIHVHVSEGVAKYLVQKDRIMDGRAFIKGCKLSKYMTGLFFSGRLPCLTRTLEHCTKRSCRAKRQCRIYGSGCSGYPPRGSRRDVEHTESMQLSHQILRNTAPMFNTVEGFATILY